MKYQLYIPGSRVLGTIEVTEDMNDITDLIVDAIKSQNQTQIANKELHDFDFIGDVQFLSDTDEEIRVIFNEIEINETIFKVDLSTPNDGEEWGYETEFYIRPVPPEPEIIINRISEVSCELYSPHQKEKIGNIRNEYEFNDVRVQIAEKKLEGYYVMFRDEKINILSTGHCDNWPLGFYDQNEIMISKIFKARKKQ